MGLDRAAAADRSDALRPAPARGRQRAARRAAGAGGQVRRARSPRRGGAWRRCSRASPPSRSCCCSPSAATAAARSCRSSPIALATRLVGADPVRRARAAEPDVGHARRARDRDLDRVQRAARPSATARSAWPGHDTIEALRRSYRRTGAAVAASGVTAIAGFGVLALSDIRMLRDFGLVTLIDLSVSLLGVLVALPAAHRARRARRAERLREVARRAGASARAASRCEPRP